jgi:hypothetical protein
MDEETKLAFAYPVVSAKHHMLRQAWIDASRACGLLKRPDKQELARPYAYSSSSCSHDVATSGCFHCRNVDRQRDPLPPIHLSPEQLVEEFCESFTRDD